MLRHELPGGYALRLLEESDADEVVAVINANRDHLAPWMPWAQHERSAEDVLPYIRSTRKQIAEAVRALVDHVIYAVLAENWSR